MGRLEGRAAVVNRRGAGKVASGVVSLASNGASYYVVRTLGPNDRDVML